MAKEVKLSNSIMIENGVEITYNIGIPLLGDEPTSQIENATEAILPILEGQFVGGVKNAIKAYFLSPLPNRFITNQKILIAQLPRGLHGLFNLIGDDIVVDADTISNISSAVPAAFLFGHEEGHKISKYRATYETFADIANILSLSVDGNKKLLEEVYADACGHMVSPGTEETDILQMLDENRREGIKRMVLKSIYR